MPARVLYIANARLPTEKAHGHAIVKMCEAYARNGLDVQLWYPRRGRGKAPLPTTIFDYYGVPPVFSARALPNVDVIRAESWFPQRLFPYLVGAHDLTWAWYVARQANRGGFALHHTRNAAVALCLARAGLSTVLEVHSIPAGPRLRLIRSLAKRPHLRGVVALTNGLRENLLALGVPDSKIVVLGSSVDLDSYMDLPSPAECRDSRGLPKDRQVVGYVGRFQTLGMEKGIPTLVAALGVLRQEHGLRPVLLCVGGPMGPVPAYIEAAGAAQVSLEDLYFIDHVASSEVPTWIGACDVGVVPFPTGDHFARFASPLKVFEFQAAGVPLVASDLPALREVLSHGENAWLVAPDDPGALAQGLARVLADQELRASLSARAKLTVTKHTWVRRAERIWARFGTNQGFHPE